MFGFVKPSSAASLSEHVTPDCTECICLVHEWYMNGTFISYAYAQKMILAYVEGGV